MIAIITKVDAWDDAKIKQIVSAVCKTKPRFKNNDIRVEYLDYWWEDMFGQRLERSMIIVGKQFDPYEIFAPIGCEIFITMTDGTVYSIDCQEKK